MMIWLIPVLLIGGLLTKQYFDMHPTPKFAIGQVVTFGSGMVATTGPNTDPFKNRTGPIVNRILTPTGGGMGQGSGMVWRYGIQTSDRGVMGGIYEFQINNPNWGK